MEIKIGEFVRTKEGYIAKCEDFYEDYYYFDETVERRYEESFESIYIDDINKKIVKHSFDIIDIIEVGDYVNGEKVYEITKNCIRIGALSTSKNSLTNIKSIVTKENFKSVEYKIQEV